MTLHAFRHDTYVTKCFLNTVTYNKTIGSVIYPFKTYDIKNTTG